MNVEFCDLHKYERFVVHNEQTFVQIQMLLSEIVTPTLTLQKYVETAAFANYTCSVV